VEAQAEDKTLSLSLRYNQLKEDRKYLHHLLLSWVSINNQTHITYLKESKTLKILASSRPKKNPHNKTKPWVKTPRTAFLLSTAAQI